MPPVNRDSLFLTQLVQSAELVVYKRFEGRYIQHSDCCGGVLLQKRQYGKERGFGLAGGGGRAYQHILVGAEYGFTCRVLHSAKAPPAAAVYIVLNKR